MYAEHYLFHFIIITINEILTSIVLMNLNIYFVLIFLGYDVDVYDKLSQPGGRAQTWTTEWIPTKVRTTLNIIFSR